MKLRRRLIAAISAVALSVAPGLLAGVAVATPADPGLGVRLLDAPTARRDDPRARSYIVDFVRPGSTLTRHIEVSNGSAAAQHVELYPDASEVAGGAFVVAAGRTRNELTSWMTVSPSSLDLPAHGVGTATVTLAVPPDAAAGERYAVVLAEVAATSGQGLLQTSRVGIRTYLSVGPGGEPASDFTVDSLTAARDRLGAPVVRAQVHNTGGRALDMRGTLTLSNGPGGLRAGPFNAQLGSTLGPADTQPVTVPLDKALPAGPWHARIDLSSGLLTRSATAVITFPDAAGSAASAARATAVPLPEHFPALVTAAGTLLAVLALALGAVLVRRRRRPDARTP